MLRFIAGTVAICMISSPATGLGGEVWELGNLKSVCVSVEVPANIGVRSWEIEDRVKAFMKDQLPRLRLGLKSAAPQVKECAEGLPVLQVVVDPQAKYAPLRLAGTLSIRVLRTVRWETGKRGMANAADYPVFLLGDQVRDLTLNGLQHALTDFARDYHKAGNP